MDYKQEEMLQQKSASIENKSDERRRAIERGSNSGNMRRKKKLPRPKLKISIGTLIEIEKWAEKARVGETKYAFAPIMNRIRYGKDNLDDTIQALTLAQIMPYKEMKNYLLAYSVAQAIDAFEVVDNLSHKYQTTQENVTERIYHVGRLNRYLKEHKREDEKSAAI